jgi:ABC-2 type transport system ATP-binding protein
MELAVETNGFSKTYGEVRAVQDVSLRVQRGEIYGFLGLNGAGKTTTIRALLGMVRPSAGTVRVLGQPVGPHGHGPWSRVGHLVESPAAYPDLTVRENLEIGSRLHGMTDRRAVATIMEKLAIARYAGRRAGTLSSGNLQRLGLARAMLHDPELLILDEPSNGLDPAGVVEIRELLRGLARQRGVTVFMSSHILTEVDRLANRIGLIHNGRLVEELDSVRLDEIRQRRLIVKARDRGAAQRALENAGYPVTASEDQDLLTLREARAIEFPDRVAEVLVAAGAPPTHLAVEQEDLEQYFLRMTAV